MIPIIPILSMIKYKRISNNSGFTLIEVLVALAIFAILTILTLRGLNTTMEAKTRSQKALAQLAEIEMSYIIIQRDIEQIINRNILRGDGDSRLAFMTPIDNLTSEGTKSGLKEEFGYNRLEFTRTGDDDNAILNHKVSQLLRVAYYQDRGELVRHAWRQVDATAATYVDKRRLLSNIEKLEISYVDAYGKASQTWRAVPAKYNLNPNQPTMALPRGIQMSFAIKDYGSIDWVFVLPEVLNRA